MVRKLGVLLVIGMVMWSLGTASLLVFSLKERTECFWRWGFDRRRLPDENY